MQLSPWLRAWPFLLVIAACIVLPLDAVGFTLPKLICITLAGFFGVLAAVYDPEREVLSMLLTTWTGRCLFSFIIIVLLSPLWSVAPILSLVGSPPRFQGVIAHVAYFTIAIAGMVAVQTDVYRRSLVHAIVAANVIVVLYGVLQIVGLDPLQGEWNEDLFLGRIFSTIGQPTMLGNFLLLTIPFVAWYAWSAVGRMRLASIVLTVLNIAVLLATASRAAALGLLVEMLVWVLIASRSIRFIGRAVFPIAFVVLLLTGVATWSYSSRFGTATQHFLSLGTRGILWKSAIMMVQERPLGYGLETVGVTSSPFLPPSLYEYESLTTKIDDVHSEPLQLLVTLGWTGTLLFYGFLILLLIGLWRNRSQHPLLPTMFIALVGTHASLSAGIADPTTSAFSWLIAGMGLGSLPSPALERRPLFSKRTLQCAALGTLATAIVGIWWLTARFQYARIGLLLRGGATPATEATMNAESLFPYDRQMLIESAETALLSLEGGDDPSVADQLHRIVDQCTDRLSLLTNAQDGMVPLLRGWQAAIRGDGDQASSFFMRARQMFPLDITILRIAARGYTILGDEVHEREMVKAIIDLLPTEWDDVASERGRILRKEQPWLEPLIEQAGLSAK